MDLHTGMLIEPWNGQAQAACAAEGTRQVLECLLAGLAAAAAAAAVAAAAAAVAAAAAHLHCHPQTLQYHILLKKNCYCQSRREERSSDLIPEAEVRPSIFLTKIHCPRANSKYEQASHTLKLCDCHPFK
jgi:hypothetical protein